MKIRSFKNYSDYIDLQKEKTTDPKRREIWINNQRANAKMFAYTFAPYHDTFNYSELKSGLCLGARTGEEVIALRDLGLTNCVGIDLVSHEDLVIEGDVHELSYEDNSIDFIYTNIFDHILDVDKFLHEVERVLCPGGKFFLQLQIGNNLDKYGVLFIGPEGYNFYDNFIKDKFKFHSILEEAPLYKTPHNHALNWNIILQKEANDITI